jgi:hypothetical protein
MTAHGMSTTGFTSDNLEKIISPPKWLYYLCGAPVPKDFPKGTMRVVAFQSQMFGVSLGIFLVLSFLSKASHYENIAGLALSALFPYMLVSYVSKQYVYGNRPIPKKKKLRK